MALLDRPWRAAGTLAIAALLLTAGVAFLPRALTRAARRTPCQPGGFTEVRSPDAIQVSSVALDGRWMAWSARTSPSGNDADVYARDLDAGRTRQVAAGAGYQDAPVVEGSALVYRVLDLSSGRTILHEVDLATGSDHLLPLDLPGLLTPRALVGGRLLLTGDPNGADPGGVYLVDLPDGRPVHLDNATPHGVALSRSRAAWVVDRAVDGSTEHDLLVYDVASGTTRVVLRSATPLRHPSLSHGMVAVAQRGNGTRGAWHLSGGNVTAGPMGRLALDRGPRGSRFAPELDGPRLAYVEASPDHPGVLQSFVLNLATGTDRPVAFHAPVASEGVLAGNLLAYPTSGAPTIQVACLTAS